MDSFGMYQHHIVAGGPPAANGYPNVVVTVASNPEILNAKENVEIHENSRLNSCLYPNLANSLSAADKIGPLVVRSRPTFFSSEPLSDSVSTFLSGDTDMASYVSPVLGVADVNLVRDVRDMDWGNPGLKSFISAAPIFTVMVVCDSLIGQGER
jgi:hypothetical protein